MWFGKAVDDFNASIISQGEQGPKLIAATGNAFTSESKKTHFFFFFHSKLTRLLAVVWVAYAFYAVPVITSLTKLNVTATKQ